MFECVINISEGRAAERLAAFEFASGASLRDRHSDAIHNRTVFTLINAPGPLRHDVEQLIRLAVSELDLKSHEGVHPRLGVVDVVPYVALNTDQTDQALRLRDETAKWMADELSIPTFLYGPMPDGSLRNLPHVRSQAFVSLRPDFGPQEPHPTAGASSIGCRDILVAWNVWIQGIELSAAKSIAKDLRSESVRALGFELHEAVQVSCNLIDVHHTRPSQIYDRIAQLLPDGGVIARCELVGLIPRSLLEQEPSNRWEDLGLSPMATIENRLGR